MFKKTKVMNVVQETIEENNNEKEVIFHRKKLSNFQFNDDILMANSIPIKLDSLTSLPPEPITPKLKIATKSKTISSVMDPVYEVKEETDLDKNERVNRRMITSPRIKYMTDFKEDIDILQTKKIFSSIHKHNYEMEKDEVITEDNNENMPEEIRKVKKKQSSHKFLENFIDKTDSVISEEFNLNNDQFINAGEKTNFEIIKEEEVVEEEEKELTHHKHNSSK